MKKLHKLCDDMSQTSFESMFSRCRWKNDCNKWWKKQCHENNHIINSFFIETMNATKWLKKQKNCVEYSLIYKIKKIEKFIFTWITANRKSYTKKKFWNFKKQLIQMSRIKKNCDAWSNKSKSKIMFWINYWKCLQ